MDSRLNVRGNAVQPLLLMFPFGLLAVAVILDVFGALGAPRLIGMLAYCTIVAALLGGAVTTGVVCIDAAAARHREADRPAPLGFLLDFAVLVVFAVILLLRMRTPDRTAQIGVVVIELVGVSVAGVAAWWSTGSIRPRSQGSRPGRPRSGTGMS